MAQSYRIMRNRVANCSINLLVKAECIPYEAIAFVSFLKGSISKSGYINYKKGFKQSDLKQLWLGLQNRKSHFLLH